MARAKHWCWTLYPDDEYEEEAWLSATLAPPVNFWDPDKMEFLVYSVERCATSGRVHLQGFLSLKSKVRASGVKKLLRDNTIHLEMAAGTPKQAADYCRKSDTHITGPYQWGVCPDKRGKKSATARAIEDIKAGKALSEVAKSNPDAWVRSHRGLVSLAGYVSRPTEPWRQVTTTILWGPKRTNKTRTAMSSLCADGRVPFTMPLSDGFWFDGYEGEDTIVIDDFYGQIKFSDMLRLVDGYYVQIPIKGGFTWAKWKKVFITSNTHPDQWWSSSRSAIPQASMEALYARFTEIVHMTQPAQPGDWTQPDPNIDDFAPVDVFKI